MRRHPVAALFRLLWLFVSALFGVAQSMVAAVFTFFLKTIPRVRREVKEMREEDYKLADRLRRRAN